MLNVGIGLPTNDRGVDTFSAHSSARIVTKVICSAPSRRAAITPQRPTAPSPTTATIFPGPTLAASAAW